MAYYSEYTFDNLSRIGQDQCTLDQNSIQNLNACNYVTQNFIISDSTMKHPIEFATAQPGINYNGGHSSSAGGANIDDSSKLQIGTIQTHPKCRIDLFSRPFLTVPYLGKGAVDPLLESQLLQGEQSTSRNSVNSLSEKSYARHTRTPLLQDVQTKINNTATSMNINESSGWIRGGLPSRDMSRDTNV